MKNTTLQILISCMHQKDLSILDDSNITTDSVVVNQCDSDDFKEFVYVDKTNKSHNIVWINTTERGLSKSRNMAIKYATADICMIADNDELFDDSLRNKIISEYSQQPQSDVLIFGARYKKKQISKIVKRIGYFDIFRVSSVQITFKRLSILDKVNFDINLGAGTPNGAGEENKFILDCKKKKLNIFFVPQTLFCMRNGTQSTWFNGFNEDFFYKTGLTSRYIWGLFPTFLYLLYCVITKHKRIECSVKTALYMAYKGALSNKINKNNKSNE